MSGSCVTTIIVMPCVAVQPLEDRHDLEAGPRVERAGRLVGQDDPRVVHQRPRDRHALLLPAGELARLVVLASGQADRAQRLQRPLAALAAGVVGVQQRQLDVLRRAGARQQVELLEDEPDLPVADLRQLVAVEAPTLMPSSM